jgi:6-methylsalicylate decarboxylase
MMRENNITTAILSISTPGTYLRPFDAPLTKEITRTTNQELSEICTAHPNYFRFFASLPLPSVKDSLAEIDYALDVLGAAGFCVLSNANGVYPGDKSLDPIFDKLNERRAILFMHPTSCKVKTSDATHTHDNTAPKNGNLEQPKLTIVNPLPQVPLGVLEYMFDETRTVANLLVSGTVTRCPEIRFIMSHAGCLLPPILERLAAALQFFGGGLDSTEMKRLLRERFYFDLAGWPWPDMIHALLRIVGPDRLMYGSDYCWTPAPLARTLTQITDNGAKELWTVSTIQDVYTGNAKELFRL